MLADMIDAGARILESACGPCIGMGQSPNSKGVSLRTFNRNFLGRSGTKDAQIYLISPEVAAYSALNGVLSNPTELENMSNFKMPEFFIVNDNMIEPPASVEEAAEVEIFRGPNIKPFPVADKLPDSISAEVVLKVNDNITTDHIMPAGSKILPYRSNIPYLSKFCFEVVDPTFAERAKKVENGVIVGGINYGQGSSREHAALVPLYLGIKVVLTKSFARIHEANLINTGILPLTFSNEDDYNKIDQNDELEILNLRQSIQNNEPIILTNKTKDIEIDVKYNLEDRDREIILAGGLLNYLKSTF